VQVGLAESGHGTQSSCAPGTSGAVQNVFWVPALGCPASSKASRSYMHVAWG
jgi:hypothetical protein